MSVEQGAAAGPTRVSGTSLVEATPPPPPASHATRLIGLVYLLLGAGVVWLLAGQAFGPALTRAVENPRLRLVIQAVSVLTPAYPGLLGLFSLISGRRPPENLNPFGLPLEGWWFETLWVMTRREIRAVFLRPLAYIVMFVFLVIYGLLFALLIKVYGDTSSLGSNLEEPVSYWLTNVGINYFLLILICPAIAMPLLAEEQRMGTLEALLTAPVTDVQVVLSKYLGSLVFYGSLLAVTGVYLIVLRQYAQEWDWGPVIGGYLGLFLIGALYLSVGLFTSSVTRSQVVAFVTAVPVLLMLFFISWLEMLVTGENARAVLRHMHILNLHQEMGKGILSWTTLVFFLSSTAFFLFLAVRGVESHKWR